MSKDICGYLNTYSHTSNPTLNKNKMKCKERWDRQPAASYGLALIREGINEYGKEKKSHLHTVIPVTCRYQSSLSILQSPISSCSSKKMPVLFHANRRLTTAFTNAPAFLSGGRRRGSGSVSVDGRCVPFGGRCSCSASIPPPVPVGRRVRCGGVICCRGGNHCIPSE